MNSWPPVFDIYASGILPARDIELPSIGVDASFTHRCAPGRAVRHIKRALEARVTVEEIFEVLKLCVSKGVQACNLGVPIVKEDLACGSGQGKACGLDGAPGIYDRQPLQAKAGS